MLSGPKRFRPLSREELENKIIELERKLDSVERQPNTSSQINSNNNSNTRPSAAADAKVLMHTRIYSEAHTYHTIVRQLF